MLKQYQKYLCAVEIILCFFMLPDAQNLIAHWKFNEAKGDSAYDISGYSNHMRLYNGAKWIKTRRDYGVDLDGVDDVCKAANRACQNGYAGLTAEGVFLIKQYNIYDQFTVIVDKWGPGSWEDDAWACDLYNNGVNGLYANIVGGTNNIQKLYSYNKLPLNRWFHLAFVWNNDSLFLFVNGVRDTACKETTINRIQTSTSELRIGNGADGNNGLFGIIDDVRLYNYALPADTILSHYNLLIKPVSEINLGMKTCYVKANDEVWLPMYVTNFEDSVSISSIKFTLNFDSSIVTFVEVSKDSGIAKNWTISQDPMGNSIKLSMGGGGQTIKYGDGELIRYKFKVNASASNGVVSDLVLSEILINQDTTVQITTTFGKIIVNNNPVVYGDLSGDNQVTGYDATGIVKYVLGSFTFPDAHYPNFTLQVADVSGDNYITSYDAALIFSYSIGLLHKFPVGTGIKKERIGQVCKYESYPNSTFKLVKSASSTDKTVFYDLIASYVKGAISSDIQIKYDPDKILVEQGGNITTTEHVTVESVLDKAAKIITISITTTDDFDKEGEIKLLTIEAPVNDTNSLKDALLFFKALIDEKNVRYLIPSVSIGNSDNSTKIFSYRNNVVSTGAGLVIYNFQKQPGTVEIYDIRGRRMFHSVFGSSDGIIRINSAQFAPGLYLYRLKSGTHAIVRSFVMSR